MCITDNVAVQNRKTASVAAITAQCYFAINKANFNPLTYLIPNWN